MEMDNSLFQENSASGDGGTLFTSELHVILNASLLENNNAGGRGGGIHADSVNTAIAVSNCTIKGNTARINLWWCSLFLWQGIDLKQSNFSK